MSQLVMANRIHLTRAPRAICPAQRRILHRGSQGRPALPERFGLVITDAHFAAPAALPAPWGKVG